MSTPSKRFVILDRDGTVIVERHYLSDPAQVELLPNAVEGLRHIRELGFGLVLVTNQSGIGRGYFNEAQLTQIHDRLRAALKAEGLTLDGIYYCPHTPDDDCFCRKPRTGLIERAAKDLLFDPASSVVIGDKASDIMLGQRASATTILVRTGYGAQESIELETPPDYTAEDLLSAAKFLEHH
jgi:D-glycero-D-manno-heptose 1,7-bisphosphate phosphatase